MRLLALLPIIFLTGCAITLPFNHRLSYGNVSSAKAMHSAGGPLQISWEPGSFPERIDSQGASGFVGGISQTRIPTGVAIASRVTESLDLALGVTPDAKERLTIKILQAESKFQYSAGIFNVTPAVDYGECTFEAQFTVGGKSWNGKYTSQSRDKAIGGSSSTGVLEKVWDDIALQVCKDVVSHLSTAPTPSGPAAGTAQGTAK